MPTPKMSLLRSPTLLMVGDGVGWSGGSVPLFQGPGLHPQHPDGGSQPPLSRCQIPKKKKKPKPDYLKQAHGAHTNMQANAHR